MKISKRTALLFLIAFTAAGTVFAQDSFSDFSAGSFSDSLESSSQDNFGGGFGDDSSSAFGDFSGDSESASAASPLEIGGNLKFQSRIYTDTDTAGEIEDMEVESFPEVGLKFDYTADNSEFTADLVFSEDLMFSDYEDVINEAYIRIYYDDFNIETGFMKVVWGKGDELKAVDILNSSNYSDFYNKDLLERKIAAPMFKINKYSGLNGLLEFVYIPYYTYPEFDASESGKWATCDGRTLAASAAAYGTEISYKNNQTLYSSQAAVRYTNSVSGFDYGFLYSYGFMPLPTVKLDDFTGSIPGEAEIKMERANIFGVEAAKVVLGLNSRAELAYYMSSDIQGDDPDIQNNKIMWVFGFDKDLPVSSMNLLIETQGMYTLKNSEIRDPSLTDYDVDFDSDDTYSQNIIIAKLKDSLNHDRIRPVVSLIYHVEDQDFMLRPELEFLLKDDISFEVLYTYFNGDKDTIFGVYEENSFLQTRFVYSF